MPKMPKISIIVPVYKVEKYLKRCVDSLVAQTLKDIEIILIDDGSPDNSPEMCDSFALSDSRIKVVHKENGGLSSARNSGLRIASGEYVGFVDSDDEVLPDMYERMVETGENYDADIVMADYVRACENGERRLVVQKLRDGFFDSDDIKREIFPRLIMEENVDYGPVLEVWRCIYKKEFLEENRISFAEDVRWSEDNLFSALAVSAARRFYYMKNSGFYIYHQNPGTITTSYRRRAWAVYRRMNEILRERFECFPDYDFSRQLQLHLLYYACNTVGMECAYAKSSAEARAGVALILKDDYFVSMMKGFQLPKVPLKLKIQIYLMLRGYVRLLVFILRKR